MRGIKLAGNDRVIGALVAHDHADLVIIHTNGSAKRITADQFPTQRRAGQGVKCAVVGGRHGSVAIVAVARTAMVRVGDEWSEHSLGLGVATGARDAAPAKIRGFEGVITEVV